MAARPFLLLSACAGAAVLFAYTAGVHMFLNSQTRFGDALRHRPGWILFVNWLVPDFELRESWFPVNGEESPGFARLVRALNTDANLTGLGRVFALSILSDTAEAARCVGDSARAHVARATPPSHQTTYVVLGLPRTGTTFLHHVLSLDEDTWRAPRFHEYMDPCPAPANRKERGWMDHVRIWIQGMKMSVTRVLLPHMSELHHVDAETPEEDVVPMAQAWASAMFPTVFYLPSYAKWLQESPEAVDHAVAHLARVLEHHFRATDTYDASRPWLLKTPQHLFEMPALVKHFSRETGGGAVKLIWLHRDPLQSMSSTVSVVCNMIGIGSDMLKDGAKVRHVANHTIEFWKWGLRKALEDRARSHEWLTGDSELIDVQFEDLTRDPLATVRALYSRFGLVLSPRSEAKMQAFIREWHGRGFSGRHKHSLERFGVERKALRRDMVDEGWALK